MIKKVIFSFQANFLAAILSLILTVITAKFLGASGRGFLSILITYVSILQLVTEIFGAGIVFFLIKKYQTSEICFISYLWFLIISFLGTLFFTVLKLIEPNYSVLFFVYTFLSSLFILNGRFLMNKLNLFWYNFFIVLQPLFVIIGLSIIGWHQFNIQDYLLYQVFSFGSLNLASIFLLRQEIFKKVRFKLMPLFIKESFKLGATNQLSNLTQTINYRLSYFYIQKFVGLSAVGVFSIVMSVCNVIWLFAVTVGTLISNETTKLSESNSKVTKLTDKYLLVSVFVTIIMVFGFFIFPNQYYVLFLNKDFSNIKMYLIMMSPAIILFSVAKVLAYYFSGMGKVKFNLIASFSGVLPSIILGWFLIKSFGIYGSILSTSISLILATGVLIYFYYQERRK
jgi:O-antigen/teichoic acid export membrane protein